MKAKKSGRRPRPKEKGPMGRDVTVRDNLPGKQDTSVIGYIQVLPLTVT